MASTPALSDEEVGLAPKALSDTDVGLTPTALSDVDVGLPTIPSVSPRSLRLDYSPRKVPRSSEELGAQNFAGEQAVKKSLKDVKMPQTVSINPTDFDTQLSPFREKQFQSWKQQYAPNDSGQDYDLRGAFKAGLTPDATTGHWPDTFKKPNHQTFSDQSVYAKQFPQLAGSWNGDTFTPPANKPIIIDPTYKIPLPDNRPDVSDRSPQNPYGVLGMVADYTAGIGKGLVYDAAQGWGGKNVYGTPFENFAAAALGEKELPMDQQVSEGRQQLKSEGKPFQASLAKASQDISAMAPQLLLPFAALPKLALRIGAAVFTGYAVSQLPKIGLELIHQYSLPADKRDPDQLENLWAAAGESLGFTALGTHATLYKIAADNPAFARGLITTLVKNYPKDEFQDILVRTGNDAADAMAAAVEGRSPKPQQSTPEEKNLVELLKGQIAPAAKGGVTITTTTPRLTMDMVNKYLGIKPSKTVTIGDQNYAPTTEQQQKILQLQRGGTDEVGQAPTETGGGNRLPNPAGQPSQVPTEIVRPLDTGQAAPTPLTAEALIARPIGTTSPEEISSLTDGEMDKIVAAQKFKLTPDATKWALAHPDADVATLEQQRQAMVQRGTFNSGFFSQWFGDAIHALTKTDQGLKNIATVTGQPNVKTPSANVGSQMLGVKTETSQPVIPEKPPVKEAWQMGSKDYIAENWKAAMVGGRSERQAKNAAKAMHKSEVIAAVERGENVPTDVASEYAEAKPLWAKARSEVIPQFPKPTVGGQAERYLSAQMAVEKTHRDAIVKALSEGKDVPPEVLADYPDLVKPATAKVGEGKPNSFDGRTQIIVNNEKLFDAAVSKNKAVVDHNKDEYGESWTAYSPAKGNDRTATVSLREKDGKYIVEDENGSIFKWENSLEDALQEAKWHVEGGETQEGFNLNANARDELLNTIDLPTDFSIKEIQDTKWGSVYYQLQKKIGEDADGEPKYENYKVSIRNHEPSPFREKEFGHVDAWYEIPKDATPQQISDAVGKVEAWAKRHSSETQPTPPPPAVTSGQVEAVAVKYKGKVHQGVAGQETHADIIKRISGGKRLVGVKRGFIINGQFESDRATAAQAANVPTTVEPGKLHSQDLIEAAQRPPQPVAPPASTPAPEPPQVVTFKDAGYKTEKAFQRDYKKNALAEVKETESEFMRRRFCSGKVPTKKMRSVE